MRKHPFLVILFFVFLSMLFAVMYHTRFSTISRNTNKIFRKISSIPLEKIDSISEFQICSDDKKENKSSFTGIPSYFRERRSSTQADFPRDCILYGLRTAQNIQRTDKKCLSAHCVSEEYVHLIYNLYSDTFSCLDIPQLESLGWFILKSGFYTNAARGISGIDLKNLSQKDFDDLLAKLSEQSQANCQKLFVYAKSLSLQNQDECLSLKMPENPLLGFLVFSNEYLKTKKEIQQRLKNQIDDRLLHLLVLQSIDQDIDTTLALYQQYLQQVASNTSLTYLHFSAMKGSVFMQEIEMLIEKMNKELKGGICQPETLFSF